MCNIENDLEDTTMTMLMLILWRSLSKKKRFDGSTVHLSKNGLIPIVTLSGGWVETIRGLTDDKVT
jgi:hypothetical protein